MNDMWMWESDSVELKNEFFLRGFHGEKTTVYYCPRVDKLIVTETPLMYCNNKYNLHQTTPKRKIVSEHFYMGDLY